MTSIQDAAADWPLPQEVIGKQELAEMIGQAINSIKNENQRRVIELIYSNAAPTQAQIAGELGISLALVKKCHERGKAALKRSLTGIAQELNIDTKNS